MQRTKSDTCTYVNCKRYRRKRMGIIQHLIFITPWMVSLLFAEYTRASICFALVTNCDHGCELNNTHPVRYNYTRHPIGSYLRLSICCCRENILGKLRNVANTPNPCRNSFPVFGHIQSMQFHTLNGAGGFQISSIPLQLGGKFCGAILS